jgi:ABC-type uncharacterized transport system substrate-binding protein
MKNIIFLFLTALSLYAHPHFFIDSSLIIKNNIISNEWKFDRLNSKLLLFDFDKNHNKVFDKDEKRVFLESHFDILKKNNYNIFLANEDAELEVVPKNLDVSFENKRVVINFDINYEPIGSTTFCTIDEKIYMAFKLKNIETSHKLNLQKSEYDYCIGVD